MTGSRSRTARLALGLAVFVIGFGGAAVLDNAALALAGSLGLIAARLTVERYPRSRD
ncbi:MAG TPA: hypothetical protein VHM48_04390 [Candidatus Limnocylindrales bacterium]|nr:hypothetical protein [Candidatus Limnocylindrales bacterium]